MSGVFGGTHTYADKLVGLSFSSSTYGQPVPIAYGTPRISVNIIDYDDFKATEQTTSSGKGGSTSTSYTYSASFIFALCEGGASGVTQVGRVWHEKEVETLSYYGFTLKTGAWSQAAWSTWTSQHPSKALAYPGLAYVAIANYSMGDSNSTGTWAFETFALLATETDSNQQISLGTGDGTNKIFKLLDANGLAIDDMSAYPSRLFYVGGTLTSGTVSSVSGYYYVTFASAPASGYTVAWAGTSVIAKDARPEAVILDFLTNAYYGAGWSAGRIADMTTTAGVASLGTYCQAMGFAISPVFKDAKNAKDHLQDILDATNSEAIWTPDSSGNMILKVIPLGDASVTGNGITYTPTVAIRANLTYDDFLGVIDSSGAPTGDDAITIERTSPADVKNIVPLNFSDRMNAYNTGTVQECEPNDVSLNGPKKAGTVDMPMITRRAHAKQISKIKAQQNCWVRNTYTFKLGWKWIQLEAKDFVTLTDPIMGLDHQLVRIESVEMPDEGSEEDGMTITAKDWPYGTGSATVYDATEGAGSGTTVNAQVNPGNTTAVIFDAPTGYSQSGGPELIVAADGGSQWGGCNIWASIDGSTYSQLGTITTPGRFGTLAAALAASGTASVDMTQSSGTLTSVTAAVAADGQTLCWCDGEILGYSTATLTGTYAYTLTLPLRGAKDTTAAAHASGKAFVRLDSSIFRYAVPSARLGNVLYLKFQSFNLLGGGVQDLSGLTAVSYTPTSQGTYGNTTTQSAREASSDWLTRAKKPTYVSNYNSELTTQITLDAQATTNGITTEKATYDGAVSALTFFLTNLLNTGAWNDLTTDTYLGSGGGSTLSAKWATVASARATLQTAISTAISTAAANAAAAAAQAAAIASSATNVLTQLNTMALKSPTTATWASTSKPTLPNSSTYPAGSCWLTTDGLEYQVSADGATWETVTVAATGLFGKLVASQLTVANWDNLVPNPNCTITNPAAGSLEAVGLGYDGGSWTGPNGYCRRLSWTAGQDTGYSFYVAEIDVAPGDQYYFQFKGLRNVNPSDGTVSASLVFLNDSSSDIAPSSYSYAIVTSVQTYSGYAVAPATASKMRLCIRHYGGSTAGDALFNFFYLRRMAGASLIVDGSVTAVKINANAIQTTNYTEDASGKPTAGAKMQVAGTALKIVSGGLQIGSHTFTDYWFRLIQAIDGSTSVGNAFYRGNVDYTTRGGAALITCLDIQPRSFSEVNANYSFGYWSYTITPTAYSGASDNLDSIRAIRLKFYQYTTSTAAFQDFYVPAADRSYDGASGITRGSFAWGWRWGYDGAVSATMKNGSNLFSGYIRASLYNAYGQSAELDYTPGITPSANLVKASGTITGEIATTGGGGGSGGGFCPAPWVEIQLSSGLWVHAADLYNGAEVAGVDEADLTTAKTGTIAELKTIWADRYRVTLANGKAPEFSKRHRIATVDRGWVEVQDLKPGDLLVAQSESLVLQVDAVGKGQVISFLVEGPHTYFTDGFLSHNMKSTTIES